MNTQTPGNRNGKTALVTGGSRGIGRAIALALAHGGADVIVNYARSKAAAEDVVRLVRAEGGEAWAVQADLSRIEDVRRLFAEAHEKTGRLDILVNNAADSVFGPLAEVTEERFDALFALNVKASSSRCRRRPGGWGTAGGSSTSRRLGAPQIALYAGTKGAVEQFAQSTAKELGPRGITVNTVSAGLTHTDLLNSLVPPDVQKQAAGEVPLGRLGEPEDIADVVAFLCSERGRWVTGQNIRAPGGAA